MPPDKTLNDGELAAAQMAGRGMTISEIASELDLTHRQAKWLVDQARKKLGVTYKRHLGQALKEAGYDS